MSDLRFFKINVRVRDLDAAVAYARDVLGATVVRERGKIDDGDMALVRFGGLTMEIISPDRPDSNVARLIERRGEGIDSIGLYADDLAEAISELEARGGTMAIRRPDLAWVHPKNPLSLSIELVNPVAHPPAE